MKKTGYYMVTFFLIGAAQRKLEALWLKTTSSLLFFYKTKWLLDTRGGGGMDGLEVKKSLSSKT